MAGQGGGVYALEGVTVETGRGNSLLLAHRRGYYRPRKRLRQDTEVVVDTETWVP